MASMAAAAYYQQLSLSLGGPMAGISGGPFLQQKGSPNAAAQIVAAFASNPYLLHSHPLPPSSAQGTAIFTSNPANEMPLQRYHGINEHVASNISDFNHARRMNPHKQISPAEVSLTNSSLQNTLLSSGPFGSRNPNSDKLTAIHDQQVANDKSFWASNYANLPTSWQLYNFRKGG